MDQEKGRKPMSPQDQKQIQKNWGFLRENLRDHITLIRDALFAKMVLNTVDKAKIDKVIKTDDDDTAIDELLKILMRSDDGSFEKFVCCLKECGFHHMVTELCSGKFKAV
ncbi:hypothetical protein SNE40_015833 [Patella caerulea]|uniref:CARD domain-containing protein n=1 Tax=Patella caerulea TaxID=87958 RepID=A0AAN8JHU8_PATCE